MCTSICSTANPSEVVTKTEWHNVVVFRPGLRDSVYDNLNKGQRVYVDGRLMYGRVEDKMGIVRDTVTIVADDVIRFA